MKTKSYVNKKKSSRKIQLSPQHQHLNQYFVYTQPTWPHRASSTNLSELIYQLFDTSIYPGATQILSHTTCFLKGIHRAEHPTRSGDRRLPILPSTLEVLLDVWSTDGAQFKQKMLRAACCFGFFAFMRSRKFTARPTQSCPLLPEDVAVDSHTQQSYLSIRPSRSKTDPFGKGITLFVGRTY